MRNINSTNPACLFYSPEQAALLAGCSSRYIRELCTKGDIKAIKLGSIWKINKQAFHEFLGVENNTAENKGVAYVEDNQ